MKAIFNKAPLTTNTLSSLSLGAIRPEGWLRAQMEAQAKGITGKLREIWPDVGNGSGFENGGQGALMPQIVDACINSADGLFIFDLIHIKMYDYWGDFKKAFDQYLQTLN